MENPWLLVFFPPPMSRVSSQAAGLPCSPSNLHSSAEVLTKICEFFRAIVRPLVDELSGDWTVHTFVVLDERTVSDRTCWLCCDAPDFLEGDRVVLKKIRSDFLSVLPETMCFETSSKCPSESGNGRLMETGEVLCEKTRRQAEEEGQMILSIMPRAFDSSQRRAVISYGLTNDTKGKARRDSKTPE